MIETLLLRCAECQHVLARVDAEDAEAPDAEAIACPSHPRAAVIISLPDGETADGDGCPHCGAVGAWLDAEAGCCAVCRADPFERPRAIEGD